MAQTMFSLGGAMAMLGWALLILFPRWRGVQPITAVVIPVLLGLAYAGLLASTVTETTDGGFGSIEAVRALFADDRALVAGWLHYLAFDLFIGAWQVREAQRVGIRHLFVIPALVLTFFFGPVGLLLFLALRWQRTGQPLPSFRDQAA